MQVDTNHLVDFNKLDEAEIEAKRRDGYEQVPEHLNRAARRALAGRDDVHISKTSGGQLSKYAAKRRKEKRRLAKKSRMANARRRP